MYIDGAFLLGILCSVLVIPTQKREQKLKKGINWMKKLSEIWKNFQMKKE